jgi:hypothetical protein
MAQDTIQIVEKGTKLPQTATTPIIFNVLAGSRLIYREPANANFILFFRGNANTTFANTLPADKMLNVSFVYTNLGKAFKPTMFQIDGVAHYPDFLNGSQPSPSTNSIIEYQFRFYKIGTTIYSTCRMVAYKPGPGGLVLNLR